MSSASKSDHDGLVIFLIALLLLALTIPLLYQIYMCRKKLARERYYAGFRGFEEGGEPSEDNNKLSEHVP